MAAGSGYQTRLNQVLREAMLKDIRKSAWLRLIGLDDVRHFERVSWFEKLVDVTA